jgi:GNAT superfamily N-acetyltransferase
MNQINPLTEKDSAIVQRMFQNIFNELEDLSFARAWRTREIGLGVWTSGRLIAVAIVCRNKLEYIFVERPYRKRGVGSLLLKEVMRLKPALYVVPVQTPAIFHWYEKHGFRRTMRIDGLVICVKHPYELRSHKVATTVQGGTG